MHQFPHRHPSRCTHRILAASVLVALAAQCALAQPPAPQGVPVDDPSSSAVVLSPDPLRLESLGLTISIPEGSSASSDAFGSTGGATIVPETRAGQAPAWTIKLSTRTTRNEKLTPVDIIDSVIQQLLDPKLLRDNEGKPIAAQSNDGAILDRTPAVGVTDPATLRNGTQELPFARVYIAMPPERGNQPVVRGVTAVRVATGQFVLFELFTTADQYQRARRVYEVTLASAVYEDPTNAAVQRRTLVEAGRRLLEDVKFSDWTAIAQQQPERWERIFRPSPTGKPIDDTEVGYRRIRVREGRSGELSRGGGGARTGSIGLIVQVDARVLEGEQVIDTQSIFFVSAERTEELWSVVMRIRGADLRGDATSTQLTETGSRVDNLMTVRIEAPNTAPRTIRPEVAAEGYLSRVEAFLLPHLLVRKGVPAVYGFYSYQSQSERITFRRDTLIQPRSQSQGAGDAWTVATRFVEGQPEQSSQFQPDGTFLSSTLPSGVRSEPTTGEALLKLWKDKGLPTGS